MTKPGASKALRTTILAGMLIPLLGGCATAYPERAQMQFTADAVSVREYLLPQDTPQAFMSNQVKAFIVLDNNDTGRNMKLCKAFERLPEAELYEQIGMGDSIVPTYWALKQPLPAGLDGDAKCRAMVEGFNYGVATVVARKAQVPSASTAYLIAIDGERTFYFDIDDGDQAQLDEVMNGWFAIAAQNPSRSGIQLTDWLTSALPQFCGSGWYDTVIGNLPAGALVDQLVGVAFRDGECAQAITREATVADDGAADS